jgi:hypothetical protein
MADKQPTYIQIDKGHINCGFHVFHKEVKGGYSWFIPGFNIRFSSETKEIGERRAITMVKAFFKYWNGVSFREFLLAINRMGFKSEQNDLVLHKMLTKKITSAKFKSIVHIPKPDYKKSTALKAELELADY